MELPEQNGIRDFKVSAEPQDGNIFLCLIVADKDYKITALGHVEIPADKGRALKDRPFRGYAFKLEFVFPCVPF